MTRRVHARADAPPALRASLAALALVATAALSGACGGPRTATEDEPATGRAARTRLSAADLAPAQRFEIRFGAELVGQLVEVLPAAEGQPDARAYPPGTLLIQDLEGVALGYISPHGTTYRFDAAGNGKTVGFGSRTTSITAFFRRNDPPTLTPTSTGG